MVIKQNDQVTLLNTSTLNSKSTLLLIPIKMRYWTPHIPHILPFLLFIRGKKISLLCRCNILPEVIWAKEQRIRESSSLKRLKENLLAIKMGREKSFYQLKGRRTTRIPCETASAHFFSLSPLLPRNFFLCVIERCSPNNVAFFSSIVSSGFGSIAVQLSRGKERGETDTVSHFHSSVCD